MTRATEDKVFFYYNYLIGGKNPKIDRNIY